MHKFEVKLPKIIKTKYNGPGWLYFYEEQKFITITTDHKIPQYYGTWPIQVTASTPTTSFISFRISLLNSNLLICVTVNC